MSAAAAAAGPPAGGGGDPWSTTVRIGGLDYTVRIPPECRPGARELEGKAFPAAVAPALLAGLAAELSASEGGPAVWHAVAALVPEGERLALTNRLGTVGDPLTLAGLRAGMLEALAALGRFVPRPGPGGGATTVVSIAGRDYRATVPEGLSGMPAALLERGPLGPAGEDACAAELLPAPGMLELMLFDEATLCDLNDRVGDPDDSCTAQDITRAARRALVVLAAAEAVPAPDEVAIDTTLTELAFADRASSVRVEVGGVDYPVCYPPLWPRFLELIADMGPLMYPAPGVDPRIQAEALAALIATAVPLVFAPDDAARIGAAVVLERASVLEVAGALVLALVGLDAEAKRVRAGSLAAVASLATTRSSCGEVGV